MKIQYNSIKLLALALFVLLSGCAEEQSIDFKPNTDRFKSKLLFNIAQSTSRSVATESDVQRIDIMLFSGERLEKVMRNITSFSTSTDGYSSVEIGMDTEGVRKAYVVANLDNDEWLNSLVVGSTTIEELTAYQTANLTQMANPPLVMYGISSDINFSTGQNSVLCQLYRAVARIDVENKASNFILTSARLLNSKVASTIFPSSTISNSEVKDFEAEAANGSTNIRLYSYENGIADTQLATKVEVSGTVNGNTLTYVVDLAQNNNLIPVERNYLYTININDIQSNDINATITVRPWLLGSDIDEIVTGSRPVVNITIDLEVGTYSQADSTLALTSKGGQIIFDAQANAECGIEISDNWLQLAPQTKTGSVIEGRFVVNTAENTTDAARTATIDIYNKINNVRSRFTVTQAAAEAQAEDKYMVVVVAGQSNAVGYDESAVNINGVHAINPNAFQLSYGRNGDKNLSIVPLEWCAQDVQDKAKFTNVSNLKGLKGIHLPLSYELTKLIPRGYKLLFVNVAYASASFITPRGQSMVYDEVNMRPSEMGAVLMWGRDRPYHKTLVDRLKYALDINSQNKFLGVVWCQGEADALTSDSHYTAFTQMADAIFNELNYSGYGARCPKGVADKDLWYTFSTTRFFVDWYDVQNAAPVFGGYKMWNPNTFIHIPTTVNDNNVGGNGVTGDGKYHFGNDVYRTVIAPAVAQCMDENGGLFNGKLPKGNRFKNTIDLNYANLHGGKMSDADVNNALKLYLPFSDSNVAVKIVGTGSVMKSGTIESVDANGLVDIYGDSRERLAAEFSSEGRLAIANITTSTSFSFAFMLKRTDKLGDLIQTIISNGGANNVPFVGFRTYAPGQRTANVTEFVVEPLYTGVKSKAVPGMLLEADNVAKLDEWIHYAVTYNHTTKLCIVYMNGQEVQRATISNSLAPSINRMLLGNNSTTLPGFAGQMIDFMVWERVIEPSVVKKVFLHSYYGFSK